MRLKISMMNAEVSEINKEKTRQFSTFSLQGRVYAIDVMQVQEVTKPLPMTPIRRAPNFVKGLINLRGQIATAIGLRELFGLDSDEMTAKMTVVCKVDDFLFSLLVDSIGDVLELSESSFEKIPSSIQIEIGNFIEGVYKTESTIISVIGLRRVSEEISKRSVAAS